MDRVLITGTSGHLRADLVRDWIAAGESASGLAGSPTGLSSAAPFSVDALIRDSQVREVPGQSRNPLQTLTLPYRPFEPPELSSSHGLACRAWARPRHR